jgi:hypothetical protein
MPIAVASPTDDTIEKLASRQLVAPALLFLVGHRPLAFAAGHVLALAAPVADLLGQSSVMAWAEILTAPDGVANLEAALAAAHASEA